MDIMAILLVKTTKNAAGQACGARNLDEYEVIMISGQQAREYGPRQR
jgi:hypothetical protein